MRLDKFLAHAGVGTRSEVKNLIKMGVVTVNGEVVFASNVNVTTDQDSILVDESPVTYQEFVYLLLNKPAGYVSAREDRKDPTVMSLVIGFEHRDLHMVGRLDKDTTGLILLTDDGKLTHRITSPKHDVSKTYWVEVNSPIDEVLIETFAKGFGLGENDKILPSTLTILPNKKEAHLTIYEGKFHQVKRMFSKYGYTVVALQRIAVGPLGLGELKPGEFRELTAAEVTQLKSL
jgi:16S rRNA pseudouridine516 synthase